MISVDAPGIQLQFFRRASKKDEAPCASYARYSLPGRVFDYEQQPNRGYARTVNAPGRQVIPVKGPVHRWIEPWYLAYAILGALASGLAVILIPLVVTNSGGSSDRFGYESVNLFAAAGALLSPLCVLPLRNRGVKS